MREQIALNVDCLEYMKSLPDNYFDLCVADPPYGDASGEAADTHTHTAEPSYNRFGGRFERYKSITCTAADEPRRERERERDCDPDGRDMGGEVRKKIIAWDVAPGKEYFDEIFRVSRNQIIWGGNYFNLPPTRCFLVWKKLTISESFTMAMAEYAWTSFNSNAKVFECAPQGKKGDDRFHPTQKPIDLYRWIYRLYAKPGDKIFDPYLGSGSSRIAAYDAGLDFVGCEIDPVYFQKQEKRFEDYISQPQIFEFTDEENNFQMEF